MIRRRVARLTRDYGLDPEVHNLEDGSKKWPCVRDLYGYNSPERRLERRVIRGLLANPFSREFRLVRGDLERSLGSGWRELVDRKRLRAVQYLVCESCVGVSLRLMGDTMIVRVA
jgi:hypothetical protein